MIKIAHEAPKLIFEEIQRFTDYDYALVHLFEEDEGYLKQFKEAASKGREIILILPKKLTDVDKKGDGFIAFFYFLVPRFVVSF